MLATDERTDLAELLAMLDGEPKCNVGATLTAGGVVTGCPNPARWITKLHCGHPFVACNSHREYMENPGGGIVCDCGEATVWVPPGYSGITQLGLVLAPTGQRPIWLPL